MKKLILIFAIVATPLFISCEKELTNLLEGYYKESMGLKEVPLDSVTRFSSKFDGFMAHNPEELNNPLYPKIKENIKSASIRIIITINEEWAGDTIINY